MMVPKRLKQHFFPALLFLIALSVEILYLIHYNVSYQMSPDGVLYSNMAENLVKGKGLVNTLRDRDYVVGPIYPLLLASVYKVFGLNSHWAIIKIQTVLQALNAVFLYKTGHELFGKKYALIPYILGLAYPLFPFWGTYVLTETLYVFLITLFTYGLILYTKNVKKTKKKIRIAILIGFIMGVANLVRPLLLLILPILFLWFWWINHWRLKIVLRDFTFIVLATILVMCPWWVRNYAKYHQFIAVTNYGSFELYVGNNPYTAYDFFPTPLKTYDPAVKAQIDKLPVLEQEREYSRIAETYILEHPLAFIKRTMGKEVNLFWRPLDKRDGDKNKIIGWQLDKWYIILGLVGAFLSLLNFKKYGILFLIVVYYSLVVSMITVVELGRYRLPIMPDLILFISLVFITIFKGFGNLLNGKN